MLYKKKKMLLLGTLPCPAYSLLSEMPVGFQRPLHQPLHVAASVQYSKDTTDWDNLELTD